MSEVAMQAKCAQWFWNEFPQYRRLLHCNMNNQTTRIAGSRAKAMGVVPGPSDLEFVWHKVYFLEAKVPGGTQSEEQKDFEAKVKILGHEYIIFYSFEEFKKLILEIIGD